MKTDESPRGNVTATPLPTKRAVRSGFSRAFNIVRELAVADFRLKYHDSVLGYIWSMLNPLLMFGIYYFVFTHIFTSTIQSYPIFLLIGIFNYTFFQDCTFSGMNSLGAKSGLIKKIYFPKTVIVFASTATCTFSYLINTFVVLVIVGFMRGLIPLTPLILLPMLCLIFFSMGVAFILASLYAHFRDMGPIWAVIVLALFWVTPIVFDVDSLPHAIASIVYFNPLTRILGLLRHYLLYNYFDLRFLLMTMLYSILMFAFGYFVFRRQEKYFAELF